MYSYEGRSLTVTVFCWPSFNFCVSVVVFLPGCECVCRHGCASHPQCGFSCLSTVLCARSCWQSAVITHLQLTGYQAHYLRLKQTLSHRQIIASAKVRSRPPSCLESPCFMLTSFNFKTLDNPLSKTSQTMDYSKPDW